VSENKDTILKSCRSLKDFACLHGREQQLDQQNYAQKLIELINFSEYKKNALAQILHT
jgi:hypothetical protein